MTETREIKGHIVTFHVATLDVTTERGFYMAKIDGWAAGINPVCRGGNAPYQGQRYTGCTGQWNPACIYERAAETYSRYLIRRGQMCRGARGTPRCISHDDAACNRRLLRDLQSTPAFSGISITPTTP